MKDLFGELPEIRRALGREIFIVGFAGGGGSCEGVRMATGQSPDEALNHDEEAIAMHMVNHPTTRHWCQNIWQAIPSDVAAGRPIGGAWFSPDCKHFSKAKGGKPRSKNIRDLAWVVLGYAELPKHIRPRVIWLENVEEFKTWGPLLPDGQPDPARKGEEFERWCAALRKTGYKLEFRELRAMIYGTPTIRKRLYMIARCDGQPIVWPEETHGPGKLAYRTAASDVIDWSIPCPSIFDRKRPLAEATLRRIAAGLRRFVLENPKPFIVPVTHQGDSRNHSTDEPLRTITTAQRGEFALVTPHIQRQFGASVGHGVDEPAGTVTAGGGGKSALVTAMLTGCGGRAGQSPPRSVEAPMSTATTKADQILVHAHLMTMRNAEKPFNEADKPTHTITAGGAHLNLVAATMVQTGYGEREGQAPRALDVEKPLGTVVGDQKHAAVTAFLAKHYGGNETPGWPADAPISTVTTQDHHHLVTAHLAQHNSDTYPKPGRPADEPISTITASGTQQAVVTSHLMKLRGTEDSHIESCSTSAEEPTATIAAEGNHLAEVRAFLIKYYGTGAIGQPVNEPLHSVTSLPRFGLVTIEGTDYEIVDIGMRMLTPRELFRAQGFPDSYIIDLEFKGKPLSKASQVRMAGNSVCPPVAAALVRANYQPVMLAQEAAE
jgi:DNA (cytosine-5)-methyltransferase 1